jgi:hypothetical protein
MRRLKLEVKAKNLISKEGIPIQPSTPSHIFGFPLFLLVPSAPLSSAVGSVSEVSAFKLTGSPSIVGLVLSFSSALCLRVFPPPLALLSFRAPVSSGVGLVFEASAFKDTGSPSWVGFSLARSLRDFLLLFCGGGGVSLCSVEGWCSGGLCILREP